MEIPGKMRARNAAVILIILSVFSTFIFKYHFLDATYETKRIKTGVQLSAKKAPRFYLHGAFRARNRISNLYRVIIQRNGISHHSSWLAKRISP